MIRKWGKLFKQIVGMMPGVRELGKLFKQIEGMGEGVTFPASLYIT